VPGFLATVGLLRVHPFWTDLYHYAWFVSFAVAFALYAVRTALTAGRPAGKRGPAGEGA
jgi:cytosine/uracil/thiamine/allantoin permease